MRNFLPAEQSVRVAGACFRLLHHSARCKKTAMRFHLRRNYMAMTGKASCMLGNAT